MKYNYCKILHRLNQICNLLVNHNAQIKLQRQEAEEPIKTTLKLYHKTDGE